MPVTCCACKNRAGKVSGKSFYRIPADLERREKWVAAINRAGWSPSEHTRLCSDHFLTGKPSPIACHPDFVPSIFNKKSSTNKPGKELERATDDATPSPPTRKRMKKSEPKSQGLPAAANSLLQLCSAADFTEAISRVVTGSEQERLVQRRWEESNGNSCSATQDYETVFELKRENVILKNKCTQLSSRLEDLAHKVTFYESENTLLRQLFSQSYLCLPERVCVSRVTAEQGTSAVPAVVAQGGLSDSVTRCLEGEETGVTCGSDSIVTEREGCEKSAQVDPPQNSNALASDNVT